MRTVALTLTFLLSLSLLGKTTLSSRERKKQFDQKIGLVFDVKETLSLPEESDRNTLSTVRSEVEDAYRVGEKIRMEKALSIAEGELAFASRKLCIDLEEKSQDIYEKAQGSFLLVESEEKSSGKKMEWDTREKIQRYLIMAKSEKDHAKEFYISGNYHMSLHTYKRSIMYSLLSFLSHGKEIPEGYQTAANVWAEPVWQSIHKTKPQSIREN
ncbi:hypothetical protein LPTSP3_g10150 [Leptospira kobayashii]|uniref:Uncharacterized protein n=1 Tax=Leptospira kobayashii TaxID=1917830 RepID=A0ABM7UHE5_9LEPT|nr:hypothetical protein [Leptospira kobayashii]BDA78085.1 hypothetical protein LPTSP3_g10150 [Leptospira kobayashii]